MQTTRNTEMSRKQTRELTAGEIDAVAGGSWLEDFVRMVLGPLFEKETATVHRGPR